jgi:hypothetical protein
MMQSVNIQHAQSNQPMELVVNVQDCLETTKPANTTSVSNPEASDIEGENLLDVVEGEPKTPFMKAQEFYPV